METTANTLLFAVIQVHQHPDVLERLLSEVEEVLGKKDVITAEDLDKLKYTEQVMSPPTTPSMYGYMCVYAH